MFHRLFLTPVQEVTQACAQPQELFVLFVGQIIVHSPNISLCDIGVRLLFNHELCGIPDQHEDAHSFVL